MRCALILYARKGKEIAVRYPEVSMSSELIDRTYFGITETFLDAYRLYDGKPVQINIHVPEGLEQSISQLNKVQYGFRKKSDHQGIDHVHAQHR